MPDLRAVDLPSRQASGQTLASIESTEYPPSTSTLRRRDARDIFDDFGIDRPSGWLSDDEDMGPTTIDGHKSISTVVRVCHSCGAPVTSRKFCPTCGHSTCVKCTSEVPGHYVETSEGNNNKAVLQRIEATSDTTPKPMDTMSWVEKQEVSKSPMDVPTTPKKPPQDIGSAVAVRNSPFVLADQRMKGAAAKPKLTPTPARPRNATRLSDCLPSQRAVSTHRFIAPSEHHSPQEHVLHEEPDGVAAAGELGTLEACPGPEEELHCKSMNSLEKKIDELYHHAEDLQNTKHIMEHLAAGASANHDHPASEEQSPEKHPSRTASRMSSLGTSISPSALRVPHRISVDPTVPIVGREKSHTIGKDPLDRVKGWARPHTLSLDSPAEGAAVPKVRLSKTPAWLLEPEKAPGNPRESLNQIDTAPPVPDHLQRPASSPPASSGITTPSKQPPANEHVQAEAPSSEGKSQGLPWHHRPLRRIEKMSNIPRHAAHEEPEFRRRQLRKVTRPEQEGSGSSQAGAGKNEQRGCFNCSPKMSHEADETTDQDARTPHSSQSGTPIPVEGHAISRPYDPDELFLPYRPTAYEKRPLTVAEVVQALASDSSIGKFSPPPEPVAEKRVERGDDMLSPVPIMPPNHTCAWRTRYMDLTAEVRQLKAEKVLREGARSQNEPAADDAADEEGLGIEGLTIVVHLRGRDDLVVNTDLRGVS
ncbi:hypothetical protein F5X68DRAFT_248028 [Plectosphaerella plurivora]|uniref:Uncharacterized protein n=1 Tax=Plectosphaerella plurivora TaxID=936078 RepID=A0A9P8VJ41_9PEZI|nr:hypothetical protein F5X68DRAFT_248028 [Plectosphaerella plurivora]